LACVSVLNFLLQREVWTCDATVRAAPQSQLVFELYVIGGSGHRVEGNLIASAVRGGVRSSCEVPSEVLVLRWAQVDFGAGSVRLEPGTTKTGEGRVFPFGVLPALKALLERQREVTAAAERRLGAIIPWVFHRDGRPIRDFHKVWRAACERAAHEGEGALRTLLRPKLLTAIPHDLRRTAARNLRRAGLAESDIMELCGWETRAMFKRYAIKDDAANAEKLAKAAGLLRPISGVRGGLGGTRPRARGAPGEAGPGSGCGV